MRWPIATRSRYNNLDWRLTEIARASLPWQLKAATPFQAKQRRMRPVDIEALVAPASCVANHYLYWLLFSMNLDWKSSEVINIYLPTYSNDAIKAVSPGSLLLQR